MLLKAGASPAEKPIPPTYRSATFAKSRGILRQWGNHETTFHARLPGSTSTALIDPPSVSTASFVNSQRREIKKPYQSIYNMHEVVNTA